METSQLLGATCSTSLVREGFSISMLSHLSLDVWNHETNVTTSGLSDTSLSVKRQERTPLVFGGRALSLDHSVLGEYLSNLSWWNYSNWYKIFLEGKASWSLLVGPLLEDSRQQFLLVFCFAAFHVGLTWQGCSTTACSMESIRWGRKKKSGWFIVPDGAFAD